MSDDQIRETGLAPLVEFTDQAVVPPPGTKARRRRRPGIRLPLHWWMGIGGAVLTALIVGLAAGLLLAR